MRKVIAALLLCGLAFCAILFSFRDSAADKWDLEFKTCTNFEKRMQIERRVERLKKLRAHKLGDEISCKKLAKVNSAIARSWSILIRQDRSLPNRPLMIGKMCSDLHGHLSPADLCLAVDSLLKALPEKDFADVCARSIGTMPAEKWFDEIDASVDHFAWLSQTEAQKLERDIISRLAIKIKSEVRRQLNDFRESKKMRAI